MPTAVTTRKEPSKQDAVLLAAVDLARVALEEIAEPGTVGAHLGMEALGERLAMHWFECTSAGYRGWRWGVSVARVSRSKVATVSETNLLPGPDATLAPEWLPYAERLAPGDLGAGDVLPHRVEDDPTSRPASRRRVTRRSTRWPSSSSAWAASGALGGGPRRRRDTLV